MTFCCFEKKREKEKGRYCSKDNIMPIYGAAQLSADNVLEMKFVFDCMA